MCMCRPTGCTSGVRYVFMAWLISRPWQSWKSAKAVAFLVVLALAIGIGSATAIFTVINALLLKPIPFEHGERFVSLLGASFDSPNDMSSLTLKDALQYQQQTRSFDVFGWLMFADYNLTAPGEPQHLYGVKVTPSLVNGLGVNPLLGNWFRNAAEPRAVLSYSLWKRLGGGSAIIGKPVTLNGHVFTISGVMPPSFNLPLAGPYSERQMDLWLPLDPLGRKRAVVLLRAACQQVPLRPGHRPELGESRHRGLNGSVPIRLRPQLECSL